MMTTPRLRAASLLAAGSLAGAIGSGAWVAHAADDGPDPSDSTSSESARPAHGPHDGPGRGHLGGADLAQALGVSEEALREAMDEVRDQLGRPDHDRADRPGQEDREDRRTALIEVLATALGLDADTVNEALAEVRADHRAERRDRLADRLDTAIEDGHLNAADKASVLKAFDVLGADPR